MTGSRHVSTPEVITCWVLGSISFSLTLVVAWWWWRDPEGFIIQRLGLNTDVWSMPWVWLLALLTAAIYVHLVSRIPAVRNNLLKFGWLKVLGIWAAIVTGIVEEVVFRHLLMDWLHSSDVNLFWQVVVSGLIFGVAHGAWALLHGSWRAALAPVLATSVLGMALAILYLTADRSALPAIASHILINLCIEPWLILAFVTGGRWDRQRAVGRRQRTESTRGRMTKGVGSGE